MKIPHQKIWLQNALSSGGIEGKHLKVRYLTDQETTFTGLSEMAYTNPNNSNFYKSCHTMLDRDTGEISTSETRMGGLGTYPIRYDSSKIGINSRVFNGKYKMGIVNFEMMITMLPDDIAVKLYDVYNYIRQDAERIMDYNWDESCMVLGHHTWIPPHFHCQNISRTDECIGVSYGVRLTSGRNIEAYTFDFLGDAASVSTDNNNTISRFIFKGKYIHQAFRSDLKDDSLFFFFVWDGCVLNPEFLKTLDLENNIYVTRYYHN